MTEFTCPSLDLFYLCNITCATPYLQRPKMNGYTEQPQSPKEKEKGKKICFVVANEVGFHINAG